MFTFVAHLNTNIMKQIILAETMQCIGKFMGENTLQILKVYREIYPTKEVETDGDGDIIITDFS